MKIFLTLLTITVLLISSSPVFSNIEVNGTVNYHNEAKTPLDGIQVFLKDLNGNIIAQDVSKDDGKFKFNDIIPGTYKLSASSDMSLDIVDLSDAYLLLGYLLDEIEFDEMQSLAADINQDGTVDWQDFENFVNGWFVNGERQMIGDLIFQEQEITVGEVQLKATTTVEGTASGDTDPPAMDLKPTTKNRKNNLEVVYSNNFISEDSYNKKYPIYLKSESNISGFMLVFNVKNGIETIDEVLSSHDISYSIKNNQVRISWLNYKNETIGKNLPAISFLLNSSELSKLQLELDESSHLIDENGLKVQAEVVLPQFMNGNNETKLSPIFPNPVSESATIQYYLNEHYHVTLDIYNTSGQLITSLVDETQGSGFYTVLFNTNLLKLPSGNYIYRLNCSGENSFSDAKILIKK